MRWHPVAQREARQRRRRDQRADASVQQSDRQVRGRDDGQQCEHEQAPRSDARGACREDGHGKHEATEEGDRSKISGCRRGDVAPEQPAQGRRSIAERQLESRAPVADEIEARIALPSVVGPVRGLRASRGEARDVQLGPAGASAELLHGVPVGIAGREIHRGVVRTCVQHLVDETDALEELRPVERGHQAHAHDHVPDGHVHRGLPLMLDAHDVVGGRPLRLQPLIEPPQGRSHGAILLP